jgi:hypothetical protein
LRSPDGGSTHFGKAEESHFAFCDQIADRARRILDRDGAIDAMLIEQIDIVGAKPQETALDRFTDQASFASWRFSPPARIGRRSSSSGHTPEPRVRRVCPTR